MKPFDEMHAADGRRARALPPYTTAGWGTARGHDRARARAEMIFRRVGITFAVYGAKDDGAGTERLIPST